jgi:hypothetical protein
MLHNYLENKPDWKNEDVVQAEMQIYTSFRIDPPGREPEYPLFTWSLVCEAPQSCLTAKEHAEFYEGILKNNGYPDFHRLAAQCRKAAAKLEQSNRTGASALKELVAAYYRRADRYDRFAEYPQYSRWVSSKKCFGVTSKTIRRKAKFWKSLQCPPLHLAQDVLRGKKAVLGDIDPLDAGIALIMEKENPYVQDMAYHNVTPGAIEPVARLLAAAMGGDTLPLRAAVVAINNMVGMLNDFLTLYPETSRKVGRIVDRWPILCSRHPRLAHDANRIMAQVDLGKDFEFLASDGARWDPRDRFTSVARDLYRHIETVRDHPGPLGFLPYAQAAFALPPIPNNPAAKGHNDAVQQWWNVAKEAFLFTYPAPEEVECLNDLINGKARQSPGRIGARILGRLEARFLSLFGSDARRKLAEHKRGSTQKAGRPK